MDSKYKEFSQRIDEKFLEIKNKYPESFSCQKGCHSCCKAGLTINAVEKKSIQDFFDKDPEKLPKIQKLIRIKDRCGFLNSAGECSIYEVRPVVCRTHGAPIQFKDPIKNEESFRDTCPLNFTKNPIGELPANFVLNLDTINTLLALLAGKDLTRHSLDPSSFKVTKY